MKPSTKNLVAGALAILAMLASNVRASSVTVLEFQQYNDNADCQGAPTFQNFEQSEQGYCYTDLVPPGPGNHVDVLDLSTHKVVARNVNSVSFSCDRPTFSTGQNCDKHFHKTIGSFCIRYYENNQLLYSLRASCYPCRPVNTITKAHCNRLINQCENLDIIEYYEPLPFPVPMKWTGRGCREDGKPVGDGGCQCDGYCGYTCERACNADSQCYWDTNTNQCFSAATNAPGEPIQFCLPSGEYEFPPLFAAATKSKGKSVWYQKH